MLKRIVKGLQLFPCHVKHVNRLQVNRLPRQSTCSQEFKKDYKQSHERECIHESNCKKSAAILLILYFLQRKTCCFKGNKRIRKLRILLPFLQQQTDCSLYQWIMIRQARTKYLLTLCNLQLTHLKVQYPSHHREKAWLQDISLSGRGGGCLVFFFLLSKNQVGSCRYCKDPISSQDTLQRREGNIWDCEESARLCVISL